MLSSTTQKNIFWGTSALGVAWALYRLFTSTGYILDDEATHFIKSKSAWVNYDIFFDGWTRAGRNLIHAPIAPLGLTATRIYTLLHDLHMSTVNAVPATIDALLSKGYKFVTVSQLIAMSR